MVVRIFRFLFPVLVICGIGFSGYWLWENYDQLPEKKEIVSTKIKEFTNLNISKTAPAGTVSLQIKDKVNCEASECPLGDKTFFVEIVKTPESRQKGLMFRENLPKNQGMFFVFDKSAIYNFWMPNVNFPLDIVWIDEDFQVVDIKTADPCLEQNTQKCPSFVPKAMAKYVLEVTANTFKGVVGDSIMIELN